MDINLKFAVWCSRKCLHLWIPPKEVLIWLDGPENKDKAKSSAEAVWAGTWAERTAAKASEEAWAAEISWTARAAVEGLWAASAFGTTVGEIKLEFVSTFTDEELKTTASEWIEYATVELFARYSDE
jgi:hypothetical protein